MKATVVYNQGSLYPETEEYKITDLDTKSSAVKVAESLGRLGYEVELLEVNPGTIDLIKQINCDLIFNICEWTSHDSFLMTEVVKNLDKTAIPYTGGSVKDFIWGCDKIKMKKIMIKAEIPTPNWKVFRTPIANRNSLQLRGMKFPIIVKPAYEHCGIGIHQSSVVNSKGELIGKINDFIEEFDQPILAEEYVDGREFQVTVFNGPRVEVLHPAEIIFKEVPGMKKFFSFESKWVNSDPQSVFGNTVVADISAKQLKNMVMICQRAFERLDCQGYTRFDIRCDQRGKVYVLELNVNPGIDDDEEYGMTVSCKHAGWTFDDLVLRIADTAYYEYEKQRSYTKDRRVRVGL